MQRIEAATSPLWIRTIGPLVVLSLLLGPGCRNTASTDPAPRDAVTEEDSTNPPLDSGIVADASTADLADAYETGDPPEECPEEYVYAAGTPIINATPNLGESDVDLTSGIGDRVPGMVVQMWHVPPDQLDGVAAQIQEAIRLSRVTDGDRVEVTATRERLPRNQDGRCYASSLARFAITIQPTQTVEPDHWYEVALDAMPDAVAQYLEPVPRGRFRQGHDARVGRIERDDKTEALTIRFTEGMTSPSLSLAPTVALTQAAANVPGCHLGTPSESWLEPGQKFLYVWGCSGLDPSEAFEVAIGGTLQTEDGTILQDANGMYVLSVEPTGWDAEHRTYEPPLP